MSKQQKRWVPIAEHVIAPPAGVSEFAWRIALLHGQSGAILDSIYYRMLSELRLHRTYRRARVSIGFIPDAHSTIHLSGDATQTNPN